CTWLDEPGFSLRLVTRLRRAGRALRVCLRDAHVSADSVFGHFVDDELLRNMRPGHVEKNGFVYRTILLLKALVFHNHGHAEQIPLLVIPFSSTVTLATFCGRFLPVMVNSV